MNDMTAHDAAPSIALLPSRGDNTPRYLVRAGTWVEFDKFGQLNALAMSMTSGKQAIRMADVTALPDAWGQAVCFHAAFFNKDHVLHDTVIAEWRGLLALIALSRLREIKLGVESMDLNALADNPRGADKERLRPDSANFGAAVRDSFPNFIEPKDKDRLRVDVLLCDQTPVGFTFDLTLAIPGRAYPDAFDRETVPWGTWENNASGYPLRDPSPIKELKEPWQRDALHQWLKRLHTCVHNEPDIGQNAATLLDELKNFMDDVGPAVGKPIEFQWVEIGQGQPLPAHHDLIRMVLTVPTDAVHPAANAISAMASASMSSARGNIPLHMPMNKNPLPSTLEVSLRASLQDFSLNGAIVIDPQLVIDLQLMDKWSDIAIPSINKSLRSLHGNEGQIKEVLTTFWKKEAQQQGWILLTPADIFTEKLTPLSKPTKFHQIEWAADWTNEYLLPFTPLVLALFDLDALRKAFRMFRGRNGGVVVELDIPLAGAEGNTLTLTKHYREEAPVAPPVRLTQWPSYVSSIWRHYYLDARGGKGNALVARTIATDRLADMLEGLSPADAVARVFAWGENDSSPLEVSTKKQNGLWHTCHLADRPVEAITLKGADGLCLAQPTDSLPIMPVDGEFKIAVDFGSSGTRILASGGGSKIYSGPLETELSYIFSAETPADLLEDVVSLNGAPLLISALATRPDTPLKTACNAPRILSFVPHPPFQVDAARESLNKASGVQRPEGFHNLSFGLKYGCKIDNVAPSESQWDDIESLLREYALFATAGVVGHGAKLENLRWAFAYPATFLVNEKEKFDELCKAATIFPGHSPAMRAPSEDDFKVTKDPLMVVEPLATYMHFRNHPRTRHEGIMITVDIGGHSTDICISSSAKLVWAGSLAIAGQHVFTDNLVFNPNALRSFMDKEAVTAYIKESGKLRPGALDNRDGPLMALRGFVEAVLSSTQFDIKKSNDHKSDSAIRLFLFGLMEYIRLILEKCHQNKSVEENLPVSLYFAGGGSRIFFDGLGEKICRSAFEGALESLPWAGPAASIFYDRNYAKMEVAEGLLAAMDDERRHVEWVDHDRILDHSPLPLGEEVQLGNGEVLGYLDIIPTSYLKEPRSIRLDSIDRFEKFLEQAKAERILLGNLDMKELLDRTCNAFEKEKRRGENTHITKILKERDKTTLIQLQPPFILALRTCIEMMVRS